jgi:hypothetical protein
MHTKDKRLTAKKNIASSIDTLLMLLILSVLVEIFGIEDFWYVVAGMLTAQFLNMIYYTHKLYKINLDDIDRTN